MNYTIIVKITKVPYCPDLNGKQLLKLRTYRDDSMRHYIGRFKEAPEVSIEYIKSNISRLICSAQLESIGTIVTKDYDIKHLLTIDEDHLDYMKIVISKQFPAELGIVTPDVHWFKVALYNKKNNTILFRSLCDHSSYDDRRITKPTTEGNLWIDRSELLCGDIKFWKEVERFMDHI